ncbi:MFS transporter [Pseudomonas sp. R3.Fl]|jgi:DHA1 family inner membrane transport protein|uniref:MFS transporter n=1 Tax=Pseudomonas citronellolis TaxID=53408 RepID=A0A1A9KBU2_9PSED|nr:MULTISPECIES: MFS transporter [Pseudomonas]ANI15015.1 MFS transporter [Pseudomonas citronellolis]KRV64675.1 MFS transporter [Pseudomonas citronellolis]KRW76235.1 MFS transporter [Pseudomonas citronellolis]MCL6693076.1 MFS transporter [Pseudomonas sp. R3.Fl]MCP1645285.1 DHA1 family inner membrane transport protein [Pseudomonas citronellolis]
MTTSTTEPRSRGAALVLFALAVGGFAIGTTEFATMSLLPLFAPALGIDAPTAGHVISAYALGVVVGAPLLAVLGARLPRRTLLVLLMGLFAIGNGLSALAPTYHWMLLFRFISGLPHGAYFGIAALVAASLVPPHRRTVAVGRMFLGLTVATIVGVPLANWLGQALGWRWSFALVAALGVTTMLCVRLLAPYSPPEAGASPLRELGALKRGQVWLTLGIGAIGFGGLFAVYTYLADILGAVTHVSPAVVPLVLAVFGVGMTLGNMFIPVLADRALMPTAGGLLVWSAVVLAIFPFTAGNIWSIAVCVFFVGFGGALGTVLQTRLMDVAEDAQGLAAALNHSAFNFANALGPFLGGLALAAGYGWTSPGWVGSLLAIGGFVLWSISLAASRRQERAALQGDC